MIINGIIKEIGQYPAHRFFVEGKQDFLLGNDEFRHQTGCLQLRQHADHFGSDKFHEIVCSPLQLE
ncbi:hypothetical protein D3C72_2529250 [compost metagenome]